KWCSGTPACIVIIARVAATAPRQNRASALNVKQKILARSWSQDSCLPCDDLRWSLEDKFHPELENTRKVRDIRAEQLRLTGQAVYGVARRIIVAVATNHAVRVAHTRVGAGRASVTTQPAKFRVVEDVEGFGAELKILALGDGKLLD